MSKAYLILFVNLFLLMSFEVSGDEPDMKKPVMKEPALNEISQTVQETERAFADTMAQRDFEGFKAFISEEAVFFSGSGASSGVLRGKQQVADAWEVFFKDPLAPFSWEPEHVEVLDSGTLAWSTGPVYDPNGKLLGTFNSVWQLDASNQWRIIFDKGSDVCNNP